MPQLISYAHKQDPDGQRFQQYETDPLPTWAVNVHPFGGTMNEDLRVKFGTMMYVLTKAAARDSFCDFLEAYGVTVEEWEAIRTYLKDTYGVETYC